MERSGVNIVKAQPSEKGKERRREKVKKGRGEGD
jgi:hypothetical protein